MKIPVQELARRLPQLPHLRLRRLLREMGREGADEVSPGEALLVWLAHWLAVTRPVAQDQQDLLLTEFGQPIIEYGDNFEAAMLGPQPSVPACVVAVMDRSFAIVSGRDAFLALHRGEYLKGLPRPPIESISYNLAGMYAQMRASLQPRPLNPAPDGVSIT